MNDSPAIERAGGGEGTQAIRRAMAILRLVARGNAQGVTLAGLAASLQLSRSTTHRILKCLVEEGIVEHRPDQRRYVAGDLAGELALLSTRWMADAASWHGAVAAVARRTGVTTYLMRRSGIEAVCVQKAEGNSVIRAIPVEVGQRRLLGFGAGATALLAALDREQADTIITAIAPNLKDHPRLTEARLRELVTEARQRGYAVSSGNVYQDVFGLGIAIPERGQAPWLAISIAVHASQVDAEKVDAWQGVIRDEIRRNGAADRPEGADGAA